MDFIRDSRGFESDALEALFANGLERGLIERSFGDRLDVAGTFLGGLDGEARVREEGLGLGRYQQESVVAGETAQVADIGGGGDEQGINFKLVKRNYGAISRHRAAAFRSSCGLPDRAAPARLRRADMFCE